MRFSTSPGPGLALRYVRQFFRNTAPIRTVFRYWKRNKFGVKADKKRGDGISGPPTGISINLTRRCNLRCAMCIQHRQDAAPEDLITYDPKRELPLDGWLDLIDQVAPFRPQIHITGGEPTLYNGYLELIEACRKHGLSVLFQTNALRLEPIAQDLVDLGVTQVSTSIDGPPEHHNAIRGRKDAFDKTCAGIRALIKARKKSRKPGPVTIINTVISKENLQVLDQMVPITASLGADVQQFLHTIFNSRPNIDKHNKLFSQSFANKHNFSIIEPSIPDGEFYESQILPEDIPPLLTTLEAIKAQAKQYKTPVLYFPNLPSNLIEPYYLDLDYPFGQECNSPWKMAKLMPDGSLSPCLHVMAGNIRDTPFPDLWNNQAMQGLRKLISKRLFPGCARCGSRNCLGVF